MSREKYLQKYEKLILSRPRLVVIILLSIFTVLGYNIKNFRLDASTDSLLLEQDADLKYHRKMSERYGVQDFLLLLYTPNGANLFSEKTLTNLKNLRAELKNLKRVSSVNTILDVPLFKSPPIPIKELKSKTITLESDEVDLTLAREEFKNSPLFKNLLVSPDLKSTAIQINLAPDEEVDSLRKRRTALNEKKYAGLLSPEESLELAEVSMRYKQLHDEKIKLQKEDVKVIRVIMHKYKADAQLFLGGVPMVTNDMISFIKGDLKNFGIGMLIFLIISLGAIFHTIAWIILPMLCCILSTVAMMGSLSIAGWEVTVISSNFISLQLIFTMALTIHLIVRFNELHKKQPFAHSKELILETVYTIFKPCLYTALTTIAGFGSLILCDILPVVNFGWMMSIGLCVSFVVTFLFFPPCLLLFHQTPPFIIKRHFHFSTTIFFAYVTKTFGKTIIISTLIIIVLTTIGISRLEVENSFIDYFKKSTEIYQGMKFVDQNFGGTTPLDVIIDFKESPNDNKELSTPEPAADNDADTFDEFEEFEEQEPDANYWFTTDKMELIENIHDYLDNQEFTGKVLSLSTILKFVNELSEEEKEKPWDNFTLALLFKELPDDLKKIVIEPFVSIENNQTRISIRMKDSMKTLRRDKFIKKTRSDIINKFNLDEKNIHLTNLMILYNNMLQSLFSSQIKTIGFTVLALLLMFMILFRCIKISLVAIFPNLLSCLTILGVMGLANIPLDMMTITIVAISIGIAVDNTIHYLHRFKREFKKDFNYNKTMFRCHNSIGKAMYYTSITIIVGFSILSLSNFIPTILFGLLTGLAMIMALISALTLLPKLIIMFKLFGDEGTGKNKWKYLFFTKVE